MVWIFEFDLHLDATFKFWWCMYMAYIHLQLSAKHSWSGPSSNRNIASTISTGTLRNWLGFSPQMWGLARVLVRNFKRSSFMMGISVAWNLGRDNVNIQKNTGKLALMLFHDRRSRHRLLLVVINASTHRENAVSGSILSSWSVRSNMSFAFFHFCTDIKKKCDA